MDKVIFLILIEHKSFFMINFRKISISETNAIARAFSEYIEKFTLQQLKIRLRMIMVFIRI